jgi:hypothetical protein
VIRSDSGLKLSSMTPADRQRPSVIQENLVFAGTVKLEGTHPREVHNGRPVNAAKDIRIEVLLEFRHATSQQMCSGPDV